jgi:ABC-type amino acid transport system permease subunit
VDKAADRLRAWRRHTDDEALRARIDEVLADPLLVRTPPNGLPVRGSVVGWGAYLWGRRATTDFGKHVATHYLTAFFIPVFPMAAHLRDGMYIYGKVPLSMAARWWRTVAAMLLVVLVTQPFAGTGRLLVFLAVVAAITIALAVRRYRLARWAAARADG